MLGRLPEGRRRAGRHRRRGTVHGARGLMAGEEACRGKMDSGHGLDMVEWQADR